MQILVLGGTVFLSRSMVETSLARGHAVTTFNRGLSGEPVPGAEALHGDRRDPAGLAQLIGRHFDLVFDTGYDPALVRASAELLEPTARHYAFVSSINAFPGWPEQADYRSGGVHDGDPDAGSELPEGLDPAAAYGWRKVSAERAVLRAFGQDRTSILRGGTIVGRYDGIGRLPWWLDRIGRGGDVLAPGRPEDVIRMIDTRDIAEFALTRPAGTFEVAGPANQTSRGRLFAQIRQITGSDARFNWRSDEVLDGKVEGWTELPLWVPATQAPGLFAHHTEEAEAAGLACRPVHETLSDVWTWMQSIDGGWRPSERTPGLAAERERELLAG
ncbi:MAG: hypothetical protein QOK10_2126 [Pseudonocardiales bacterium]|jgi:2'-hydroxyisoflavone reductase|nr:hypothetical protein [Pseudonocardiales bacterium]